MIFSLFLAAIFFFILFFFGWQLVRRFLKEDRIEYLLGLSGIFGLSFYVFFVNALGYFIPIKIVFYLVWLLFFVLSLALFYFNKSKVLGRKEILRPLEWGIDRKWKKILLGTTLFLVVVSGLVFFRYPPVIHGPGGLPITATMADGNFPPLEIWNPNNNLRYHYTLELVSAGIYKTTGLPIHLANVFQVAILVGILFLLGFSLVKRFLYNNNFGAFISSLTMIYAGGLVFLSGLKGIPVLYNLYIRHQEMMAPFKFVTDSVNFNFSGPVLNNVIRFTWGSLTFSLIIAVIYLYFHLVSQQRSKMVILFCALLFAVLAFAGEVFFAVLWLIVFIYPFIFGLMKKDWQQARKFLSISFWILLIATPLAFVQGGFLRSVLDAVGSRLADFTGIGVGLFRINEVSRVSAFYESEGLPIFRPEFYTELGLLLILLIPAFVFLFKRNFQLGFFLAIFTMVSLSIAAFLPLRFFVYMAEVFHYFVRMGEMWRFFFIVNLIGGLAVGLFLAHLYLSLKKIWFKRLALFLIIILMTQGFLFQLLYLSVSYPAFTWNASAQYYAKPGSSDKKAYDWVRENTAINDFFLITKRDCDDTSSFTPNYRFVINTGRMAPIYSYHCLFPDDDSFKKIKEDCDPLVIKDLRYSYLYVNKDWIYGLEEKCLANNNLELKFKAGEGNESVRIYKVK